MASGYTVGQHRVGNKQCAVKPSAVFPCSNKWVFIRSHVYQQFSMPFSIWLDTADVSSSPASLGAALQQPLCLNHFAFPMCFPHRSPHLHQGTKSLTCLAVSQMGSELPWW